ncbi:scarecrow-like protein 21 [Primulina huaijiensis]|uniref:scarecrow-like protein 21 n=1 Tax=Primulina huaijiensis TaxID=1492673 RepID=UPI003CC77EB9
MQDFEPRRIKSNSSNAPCHQPVRYLESSYSLPLTFQSLDHHSSYNNNAHNNKYSHSSIQNSKYWYSTLESSSLSVKKDPTMFNSPSEISLPHQESKSYLRHSPETNYGSPSSVSCITEDANNFRNKLKELETVMFGPDIETYDDYMLLGSMASADILDSLRQMTETIPKKDLKQLLIACAKAISNNDLLTAQWLVSELRQLVSVSGEPMQRLGAYVLEGLVAKLSSSGSSIYKSLICKEPASFELLSYMHILFEICPYFKFGYMSANGAIAEAMKNEDRIHIIDFQICQGSQWISLIRAFASRPRGPPHIRITGIDDLTSAYARGGGLNIVGRRLSKLAKTFKVPFEFHGAAISDCDVNLENLGIRPNEALAVNFAFMLHRMPDESVNTENHRDRILRMVKGLNPQVVTLVEQEFNTNTAAFYPRFLEALGYYTAMFESIDATLPREHKARINVEQHCLARDVVNIMACEGTERVERHELLGKWRSRFSMAGFSPYPLNSLVNATIKTLLQNYCNKYRLEERDGALYLGWMDRDLIASCAWK